jgi:hypothetical protein
MTSARSLLFYTMFASFLFFPSIELKLEYRLDSCETEILNVPSPQFVQSKSLLFEEALKLALKSAAISSLRRASVGSGLALVAMGRWGVEGLGRGGRTRANQAKNTLAPTAIGAACTCVYMRARARVCVY